MSAPDPGSARRRLVWFPATTGAERATMDTQDGARVGVLVVDDDPIVRSALSDYVRSAGDLELVGTAVDGQEALAAPRADVVLMDVQMPRMNGIEAMKELLRRDPTIRVIVLTAFDQDAFLRDALEAGAAGFLLKVATPDALVEAVRGVSRGNLVMSPESTRLLLGSGKRQPRESPRSADLKLSRRELDILRELCAGASNSEIAATLFLSESTVKTHVSTIMAKLGATSRLKAVVKAHEWNLLDEDR